MSDISNSNDDSKKKYSALSSSSSVLFQPETPVQKSNQPFKTSTIATPPSEQKISKKNKVLHL